MDQEAKSEKKTIHPRATALAWYKGSFFKNSVGLLLVLSIIFVFYQVAFLLTPLLDFISILAAPVIISYVFYYLFRPIVHKMESFHIPRSVTILVIYVFILLFLIFFFAYVGPILAEQITAFADISVETLDKIKNTSQSIVMQVFNLNLDKEIEQRLLGLAQQLTTSLSKNLLFLFSLVTRLATILAVIPFIVFYLLKDDHDFAATFMGHMPDDFVREIRKILSNIDTTLSSYINGLVIISLSVGAMLFVGYLIIGLNYALILSLIAVIFMTIPFLGPFLAITPALFVGLSDSPLMVVKVAVVFIIVQQLESNVISPQVIGQKLHIHPLTVILLLLAAGTLYGLIGLLLATPLYALLKVVGQNLYKIYELRYSKRISQTSDKS